MTDKRWNGTGYTDLTTRKRWAGTSWVDLTTAKRWNGTSWTDIPLSGGLSVTVAPAAAMVNIMDTTPGAPPARRLTTNTVTVTAVGGSGSGPTYEWTQVSGTVEATINSPTSATTSFSATVYTGTFGSARFRCRVTRGAETVDVFVTAGWEYVRLRPGEVPL